MSSPVLIPPENDKPDSLDESPRTAPPLAKRPAWARAIVAVAALGLLCWAGTSIVGQVRAVWPAAETANTLVPPDVRPRTIDGMRPVQEAQPTHHSRVAIGKVGGRTFVSLGKIKFLPELREEGRHLLLEAELFRQAFLIAARDGLGTGIRDEMLGEPPAPATDVPGLEIHYRVGSNRSAQFTIRRPGDGNKVVWGRDFVASSSSPPLITPLIAILEKFSRADLPKVLSEAGVVASRPVVKPDARLPETVETDLGRMSFASQFSAVRSLHEAIRVDGETPGRLAALARGYANLGVLTEHHWNASHKAYEARALLYAERLQALRPDVPESLWVRAYARGLVGLHRFAIEDLDLARRKVEAIPQGSRPTPPAWVALVDQLCRFDTNGLLNACKDSARASLAAVFAVKTVEQSNAFARAVEVTRLAQEASPDNLWILDASSRIPQLSHLHVATVQGLALFGIVVPRDLGRVAGLPDDVAKLLGAKPSASGEAALAAALAEAGTPDRDPGEPSWSALAKFVREARFAQVARRVEFMATMWSVPVEDFLDQVEPVASDHPYWPALEAYAMGSDPVRRSSVVHKLRSIPSGEFEGTETLLYRALQSIDAGLGKEAYSTSLRHCDFVERDYAYLVRQTRAGDVYNVARALADISPNSPIGAARMIVLLPDEFNEARIADLSTRHEQHPEFLVALGTYFTRANKPDEAVKAYNAAIKLSPDTATYRDLADLHRNAGRMDEWKSTLDAFLAGEDQGLGHARVQVELAQYHMSRGEWDLARPYADAAAQSWAGWAMTCAAQCYEGMKDWEQAELWIRRLAERYPGSRGEWFAFCMRTGHGDVDAAGEFIAYMAAGEPESLTTGDAEHIAAYLCTKKEPKRAIEFLASVLRRVEDRPEYRQGRIRVLLHVAALADEVGDVALFEQTMDDLISRLDQLKAPHSAQLCRSIRDKLAKRGSEPLDLGPIDQAMDQMTPESRAISGYIVGRFAEQHGQKAKALKYYGYSLNGPATGYVRGLSAAALRELGVNVGPGGEL